MMRPKKPRLCIVLVVIGGGFDAALVERVEELVVVSAGDGVGEASNRLRCARTVVPSKSSR